MDNSEMQATSDGDRFGLTIGGSFLNHGVMAAVGL